MICRSLIQNCIAKYRPISTRCTRQKRSARIVWRWVHDGHDFLSNGWYYAFEGGILMDIVSALRFDDELAEWVQAMSLEEFEEQFGEKELNGPSLEKLLQQWDEETR